MQQLLRIATELGAFYDRISTDGHRWILSQLGPNDNVSFWLASKFSWDDLLCIIRRDTLIPNSRQQHLDAELSAMRLRIRFAGKIIFDVYDKLPHAVQLRLQAPESPEDRVYRLPPTVWNQWQGVLRNLRGECTHMSSLMNAAIGFASGQGILWLDGSFYAEVYGAFYGSWRRRV